MSATFFWIKTNHQKYKKSKNGGVTAFFVLFWLDVSRLPTKNALSPPFFNVFEFWWLFLIGKNLADKKYPIIFFRIQPPYLRKTCLIDFSGEGGLIRKKIITSFLSARFFAIRNRNQNWKIMKNGCARAFFVGIFDTLFFLHTKKSKTP